jgi:hypothetical protein
MLGVQWRGVSRKRVFNPKSATLPTIGGGLLSMNPRQAVVECEPANKGGGNGKNASDLLKEEDLTSFGHLVFGNRRDENIVAACIKAHGEFVVLAVILSLNLVAQEGDLEREVLTVGGATFNELCEVGLFVATKPHSHTTAFVVGINHIDDGGFAVFAFNACLVRLNDVARVQGVKFGLDAVTVWINRRSRNGCVFCHFSQECFNFTLIFAHFFHLFVCRPFCCLDKLRLSLRLFIG